MSFKNPDKLKKKKNIKPASKISGDLTKKPEKKKPDHPKQYGKSES